MELERSFVRRRWLHRGRMERVFAGVLDSSFVVSALNTLNPHCSPMEGSRDVVEVDVVLGKRT